MIGPLAVAVCPVPGSLAERLARQRAALGEHRRAIEAQLLEERSLEARRLSAELFGLLERNHDASSVVSTALLDAEALRALTDDRSEGPGRTHDVRAAALALRDDLLRLARLLAPAEGGGGEGCEIGRASRGAPAVRAALGDAGRRFPGLSTSLEVPAGGEAVAALIHGGEEKLACLLAGLLANACEGDGTRGAKSIAVTVASEADGAVSIQIADDGPGFAPASSRAAARRSSPPRPRARGSASTPPSVSRARATARSTSRTSPGAAPRVTRFWRRRGRRPPDPHDP